MTPAEIKADLDTGGAFAADLGSGLRYLSASGHYGPRSAALCIHYAMLHLLRAGRRMFSSSVGAMLIAGCVD